MDVPNALDVLAERGFVYQVSDEAGLRAALEEPITLYCGYDPSAGSLTVGHLLTIMAMRHLQRHGHRTIAVVGGGTGMIGDPTDKSEARPVLSEEQIEKNVAGVTQQLAYYLVDGGDGSALVLNNAEWLRELRHIEFLRDVGRHFSVNEMLATDTYRTRLESTGLSYLELSYRPLQGYDFLHLYRNYGCVLQIGGSDQWSNILAGVDLIRRAERQQAFGMVAPLLTTASGAKMGKTAPPFSGIETPHLVEASGKAYFANCAWDAFGVAAALHCDADIKTSCADCGEPMELQIRNGEPVPQECAVHFAVPAAQWWDDIIYT